jgi:hypothetical protein
MIAKIQMSLSAEICSPENLPENYHFAETSITLDPERVFDPTDQYTHGF